MKAKYGITQKDIDFIENRDKNCVYCNKLMVNPWSAIKRDDSVTIEHLNHKKDWDSVRSVYKQGGNVTKIIALCCNECNLSRSDLALLDWFTKAYCKEKNVKYNTVAPVVRDYIDKYEKPVAYS